MSNSDSKEPYAWLLTVAQKDCGGFAKILTRQHPADYVLANDRCSPIFAIPLSKKQYLVAQKWYEGNNGITDSGPRLRAMNDALEEIDRLRLTAEERKAIGVTIQCVEAAKAQRHPEEQESRELLHKTACVLGGLFDRTK